MFFRLEPRTHLLLGSGASLVLPLALFMLISKWRIWTSQLPLPGKTFGAKVRGVELQNLSQSDFTKIIEAFIEYGLLIFPKLQVDQHTQKQFASRFGRLRFNGTPMIILSKTTNMAKFFPFPKLE